MAIFYRWAKGYNDVSDQPTGAYSFLQWPTKIDFDANNTNDTFISEEDISPKFYLNKDNTNTSDTIDPYVGRVLLDRATSVGKLYCQNIHLPWLFKNKAGIGCNKIQYIVTGDNEDNSITESNTKGATISLSPSGIDISALNSVSGTDSPTEKLASIANTGITFNKKVDITGTVNITGKDKEGWGLNVTSDIVGHAALKGDSLNITHGAEISGTITGAEIISNGLCQANYFNAKSDLRAKTNIKTADFSEEFIDDILAAIVTYEFKNKSRTDPRFIGLIAQEVVAICVEHDVDPHMFVSNMDATGVNNDYMYLNINNLMFLFAQCLRYTRNKQQYFEYRLRKLEDQFNG